MPRQLFFCQLCQNGAGFWNGGCLEVCASIKSLYSFVDAVNLIVVGDFNCSISSRFYSVFLQFTDDNNLVCADLSSLDASNFTYSRDDGANMTWIDHILCSKALDTTDVCIHYDYICSDHKPLSVCFKNVVPKMSMITNNDTLPADRLTCWQAVLWLVQNWIVWLWMFNVISFILCWHFCRFA